MGEHFTNTKITDFQDAVARQEKILTLHITMENFLLVLQSAKRRPDDSEGQLSQKGDIEDEGIDDSSERPKKMQKTGNAALK